MDKKSTKVLMQMLYWNGTIDQMARANSVCWHEHVLSKDMSNILRRALDLRANDTRKLGRPRKTWLRAVAEQSRKIGLSANDAKSRS